MTVKSIGPSVVHVVVDMQRMFSEPGSWQAPTMPAIVPNIVALVNALPARSLFTRFVVPCRASDAPGHWRRYYERWSEFTGERMPPEKVELVPELAARATPATTFDKPAYSAFEAPAFVAKLEQLGADALIFSGVETDVCVLGTLLAAVDRGYRVIAAQDAMTSSSQAGHEATLRHVLTRFDQQVEIAPTTAILAALA